jgi:hypothetical protein
MQLDINLSGYIVTFTIFALLTLALWKAPKATGYVFLSIPVGFVGFVTFQFISVFF